MKLAVWRLVLMAALFVCWLGYLGYLVATRPRYDSRPLAPSRPLVLSRPQLLVSEIDVIARVDADDPTKPVKIQQILYPPGEQVLHVGDEILVDNLNQCRPLPREGYPPPRPDWDGPGDYLLPLNRFRLDGKTHYRVTPTPPSPGYPPSHDAPAGTPGPPRIYPATRPALAQYRVIRKP
jgi:hypothetical protein